MDDVSFRELAAAAAQRGLSPLPPFLSVTLVAKLCNALESAHQAGTIEEGTVALDTVHLDLAGQVSVRAWGRPEDDVAAAALVLDELLGETLDAELTRIIAEARAPAAERRVATARALEQRLGHWLVKQLQVHPGKDLGAELAAWLFPAHAPRPVNPEVAAWLEAERVAAVLQSPSPASPRPAEAPPARALRLGFIFGVAGLILGLGFIVLWHGEVPAAAEDTGPPPAVPLAAVAALRPAPPGSDDPAPTELHRIAAQPQVPPGPYLPRAATGVPAAIELSSDVHGIDLEQVGLRVDAPSPRWGLKTAASHAKDKAPEYAALFVASVDGSGVRNVSVVGPKKWSEFVAPSVRVFAVQPDQAPGDGSFSLEFASITGGLPRPLPKLRHASVLIDAMAQQEGRRFILSGLSPTQRYVVSLKAGPASRVVATASIPRKGRVWRGGGFQQAGSPIDQVLLQPGVPVELKGASRVSFVVLTTQAEAGTHARVEVFAHIAVEKGLPLPPPSTARTTHLEEAGATLLSQGDGPGAAHFFKLCLQLDGDNTNCQAQLRRANAIHRK